MLLINSGNTCKEKYTVEPETITSVLIIKVSWSLVYMIKHHLGP